MPWCLCRVRFHLLIQRRKTIVNIEQLQASLDASTTLLSKIIARISERDQLTGSDGKLANDVCKTQLSAVERLTDILAKSDEMMSRTEAIRLMMLFADEIDDVLRVIENKELENQIKGDIGMRIKHLITTYQEEITHRRMRGISATSKQQFLE